MSIGVLSRLVGCSERALRNAFYGVHGVGPKQWIRSEQLESARQALIMANGTSMTVTIVATEHGFNELGRFAATYRRAFGEPPSETLRGGRRKLAAAATTEGQAHVCTT